VSQIHCTVLADSPCSERIPNHEKDWKNEKSWFGSHQVQCIILIDEVPRTAVGAHAAFYSMGSGCKVDGAWSCSLTSIW